MVGVNDDFATVLFNGFGDYLVLVELRLLVGAVEQVLNAAKTVNQATSGSRGARLGVVTASGIPEVLVKHLQEFSYCQRT